MAAILLLGGGAMFFVCILAAIIGIFIWKRKKSPGTVTASKDGSVPASAGSLKEEVPAVLAAVKGEKAKEVIAAGYFGKVYPGVTVVTKPQGLPANTPAFQLLTDSTGTITGVNANSVLWDSGETQGTVPTTKPTKKPK